MITPLMSKIISRITLLPITVTDATRSTYLASTDPVAPSVFPKRRDQRYNLRGFSGSRAASAQFRNYSVQRIDRGPFSYTRAVTYYGSRYRKTTVLNRYHGFSKVTSWGSSRYQRGN